MSNERPSSFMDRNTLLAVILVMVSWVGWQKYLEQKYPDMLKKPDVELEESKGQEGVAEGGGAQESEAKANSDVMAKPKGVKVNQAEAQKVESQQFSYEDSVVSLQITNRGLALQDVVLKKYKGTETPYITLAQSEKYPLFETQLLGSGQALDFVVERKEETIFVGRAQTQDGTQIVKTLRIRPETYAFDIEVEVQPSATFKGLDHVLVDHMAEQASSSFFMPNYHFQDLFSVHGATSSRVMVDIEKPIEDRFEQVKLAALGTSYFVSGLIDDSQILPSMSGYIDKDEKVVVGRLTHQRVGDGPMQIKMTGFAGPKDLGVMEPVDPLLKETVDFGWFSPIGFGLLKLLKTLYSLFPNYGVAIILLTLIVRILVLPFNISSYRSMKKMQTINPILKGIREKYKGDPQKLNTETMRIMKENKVNPLGGCLPMLIQLPIFLSLYRVFGQSIELYHAPFALWISDLSLKDPYYVLPVLMGGTMFLQQKLTPTTMDPAQAKVMAFLPLIFSFFMLSLPSSLTLYIFVSTLFGVIQQYVFLRDSRVIARSSAPQVNT